MSVDRIIDWSMTKVEIPFRTPFTIITGPEKRTLHTRSILELKVHLASGQELESEAHPLPGLHAETIEFCQQELETFLQSVRHLAFEFPSKHLAFFELDKLSGSGRVAIEGLFLPWLFSAPKQVRSQALVVPDLLKPLPAQLGLYKYLKIKLGRLEFKQELAWAEALHEALPSSVRWRLDGNQQLTLEQVTQLSQMPFKARIDYIEEPVKDFFQVLCSDTQTLFPLPFALDESLKLVLNTGLNLGQLKSRGLKAFIIRPPSLAGYSVALKAIEMADSFDLLSVLSSSFEGPLGFERLLCLLSVPRQSLIKAEAHGLDTITCLDFEHFHVKIPDVIFFKL
ncbi:MAG: hypothetical protein HYV97_15090 [Bdellovibrio sp.]|nr:hypothetical protein [Bdellovibrio sp.]